MGTKWGVCCSLQCDLQHSGNRAAPAAALQPPRHWLHQVISERRLQAQKLCCRGTGKVRWQGGDAAR